MVEKENDIAAAVPNNIENNANAAATDPAALAPAKDVPVNNDKHNVEDLMGLARFFLKEYYTKLSDCPEEAITFYGDDSHFVHGDVEETGRENIQRAIANMGFEDCKARFYSLKTVALPMQGDNTKLIQVCGELTLVKAAVQKQLPVVPRRFVQTIILAHQTPTMLYVKSDVFQWLDTAFHITAGEKYNAANNAGATVPSPPTTVVEQQQPLENGDNKTLPMVNGGNGQFHQIVADVETKKTPVPVDQPHKVAEEEKAVPIEPEKKPTANVVAAAVESLPSPPSTPNKKEEEAAAVAAGPPPPAVVDGPKTTDNIQQQPPSSESVSVNVNAATVAVLPPPPAQQPTSVVVAVATTAVVTSAAAKPKTVVSGSYAAIAAAAKGQPMPPSKIVSYHQPHKVPESVANFNSSNGNAATPSASTAVPTMTASNKPMPPPPQQQQQKPPPQQQQKPQPVQQKPPPVQQVTPLPQQQQMDNGNANDGSKQSPPLTLPPVVNVAPRRDWVQQELMREIQAIADGVEFVGIKPNSLRREYRTAFGFIDFTTSADMQAVYDACKRDPSGAFVLNVRIPEFDFNDGLLLSADKTNNLGGGGYSGGGGGYR
uniref:NTF2 domain-containing protein n=1 Tax=Globodera rostochiensis TaxID=31243 RepID=A0A914IC74_GLORO